MYENMLPFSLVQALLYSYRALFFLFVCHPNSIFKPSSRIVALG
jgi:hypothetical protein